MKPYTKRCRTLRKKQTDTEKKLWNVLRNRQAANAKFRRQYPAYGYILDFYCPEFKLCIEADGGQHYEEKNKLKDELRTNVLNKKGVTVLRFNDREILQNIEGVKEKIGKTLLTLLLR